MTLQSRRRIFYSLITCFVIIGGVVVLYVNGWRMDFKTFKIEKVGAIFVRSFPQEATITLDGKKIENKSGFFEKGTLVNGLFPQNYTLRLTLDGYEPWEEGVSVAPSLVTEVSYAVLVPKNPITVATSAPKNFWVVDGNVVTQNDNGVLAMGKNEFVRGEVVEWAKNGASLLAKRPSPNVYYAVDLDKKSAVNVTALLQKAGLTGNGFDLTLNPENENELIISEDNKISVFNTDGRELTNIYKTKMDIGESIAPSKFLIAWTKFSSEQNTSTVVVFDKFLKKVLEESPSLPGKSVDLRWASGKRLVTLQDNGELYLYDYQNKKLGRIAMGARKFELSADGSWLASVENNALEVFSLDNDRDYHRFNFPEIQSVSDVGWYGDNNHLFVFYPNRVIFFDINDASLRNLTEVASNYVKAVYDEKTNALYTLENGRIERRDFPR